MINIKETGIIRKIDELGRIVIPKEIRKKLRITSKDYLDIFLENEQIILMKYDLYDDLTSLFNLLEAISVSFKIDVVFALEDNVVYSTDPFVTTKDVITKKYLHELNGIDILRISPFEMFFNKEINAVYYAKKLLINSEDVGVLIFKTTEIKDLLNIFKLIEAFVFKDTNIE